MIYAAFSVLFSLLRRWWGGWTTIKKQIKIPCVFVACMLFGFYTGYSNLYKGSVFVNVSRCITIGMLVFSMFQFVKSQGRHMGMNGGVFGRQVDPNWPGMGECIVVFWGNYVPAIVAIGLIINDIHSALICLIAGILTPVPYILAQYMKDPNEIDFLVRNGIAGPPEKGFFLDSKTAYAEAVFFFLIIAGISLSTLI